MYPWNWQSISYFQLDQELYQIPYLEPHYKVIHFHLLHIDILAQKEGWCQLTSVLEHEETPSHSARWEKATREPRVQEYLKPE